MMKQSILIRYGVLGAAGLTAIVIGCADQFSDTASEPAADRPIKTVPERAKADRGQQEDSVRNDDQTVTAHDVAEQTREALKTTGRFIAQNKDEFIAEVRQQLAEIDAKIQEMRAKSDEMTAEARAEWNSQYKKLQERRAELEQKLDEVKKSSGGAWQQLRDGAVRAWDDFEDAVRNAADDLDSWGSPPTTSQKTE